MTMIQTLGQEWVLPGTRYWTGSRVGEQEVQFCGTPAIMTNHGWLILARVERIMDGPDAGRIRRVPIKIEELNCADYEMITAPKP